MAQKFMSPTDDAQQESPSQDHGSRFVDDQDIRDRGYEVTDRPKDGPVMWCVRGNPKIKFTQAEVVAMEKLGHDQPFRL